MPDEVADVIAKLREIEAQAFSTCLELPKDSIAFSRLRHIVILAKYARLKLQGITAVYPLDSATKDSQKETPP